jgi:hypothetical protein
MGEMKHSVESRTRMVLCVFDRSRLWEVFRGSPQRAYDLTWIAAVEEHFLGETIASLGQRDAGQRIAWALLRIWQRLRAAGLGGDGTVPLPFRQQDLADALGLSLVHTNKTLARFRSRQLCDWSESLLRILDAPALAALGGDGTRAARAPAAHVVALRRSPAIRGRRGAAFVWARGPGMASTGPSSDGVPRRQGQHTTGWM